MARCGCAPRGVRVGEEVEVQVLLVRELVEISVETGWLLVVMLWVMCVVAIRRMRCVLCPLVTGVGGQHGVGWRWHPGREGRDG